MIDNMFPVLLNREYEAGESHAHDLSKSTEHLCRSSAVYWAIPPPASARASTRAPKENQVVEKHSDTELFCMAGRSACSHLNGGEEVLATIITSSGNRVHHKVCWARLGSSLCHIIT